MQADCDIVNIVQWQTKAKMYYINNKDSNSILPRKYFTRISWFCVIYWLKRFLKELDIFHSHWLQCKSLQRPQIYQKKLLNCFGKCTNSTWVALLKMKQFYRIIILLRSVAIWNRILLKDWYILCWKIVLEWHKALVLDSLLAACTQKQMIHLSEINLI